MDNFEKKLLAMGIVIISALTIATIFQPTHNAYAPSGRRGVPSEIMNGVEFMAWPQTEHGLIKTVSGKFVQNTDMVFASVPVGQDVKNYFVLKQDPARVAENTEISVDPNSNTITIRWWETNPALKTTDKDYTIPYRTISTDGGITWSHPQNISDLPDTPAKIIPIFAHRR